MKRLIYVLLVVMPGCATVRWTGGEVPVAMGDDYSHNVGWYGNLELGFRSDGVLVWRAKQSPKTNP